jgi:hypothetical protein
MNYGDCDFRIFGFLRNFWKVAGDIKSLEFSIESCFSQNPQKPKKFNNRKTKKIIIKNIYRF